MGVVKIFGGIALEPAHDGQPIEPVNHQRIVGVAHPTRKFQFHDLIQRIDGSLF